MLRQRRKNILSFKALRILPVRLRALIVMPLLPLLLCLMAIVALIESGERFLADLLDELSGWYSSWSSLAKDVLKAVITGREI